MKFEVIYCYFFLPIVPNSISCDSIIFQGELGDSFVRSRFHHWKIPHEENEGWDLREQPYFQDDILFLEQGGYASNAYASTQSLVKWQSKRLRPRIESNAQNPHWTRTEEPIWKSKRPLIQIIIIPRAKVIIAVRFTLRQYTWSIAF